MNNMFNNEVLPWELNDATNDTATVIKTDSESVEEIADFKAETIEVQGDAYPVPETSNTTEGIEPDVDFGGDDIQVTEEKVETPAPDITESVVQTIDQTVESSDNENEAETDDVDVPMDAAKNEKLVSNLTSIPASDLNFIGALESATKKELETALAFVKEAPRSATKVAKIEARIKKLSKEEEKAATDSTEETGNTETTDSEETANETETEEVVQPTVLFEDTFNKIDQEAITDKDKSIMYLMEHYKISPDVLNSLISGDFTKVWDSIKELNSENLAVKEKLTKELGKADDDRIKVVKYLVDKAKDIEFAKQILLDHKDFNRCYKYITEKVKKAFTDRTECIQVNDDTVYAWAVEYYMLDDYEAVMKERAEEAERKRKAEEAKKRKKSTVKKTTVKKKEDTAKTEDKTEETPVATVVKPEEKVEAVPTENKADDKPLTIPTISDDEQKEVEKIVEAKKADKENEAEAETGFNAITDNFGQLTFAF